MTSTVFKGENPFNVPIDHYDRLATPQSDVKDWSETHFWSVWNPDEGVGLFIHVGIEPADPTLWWAQVIAYLPNGMVAADRSWGRSLDRRGPTTGNFRAICVDPLKRWLLRFNGAVEVAELGYMNNNLLGAGPAVPMEFEVLLTGTMPVWDLFKAVPIGNTDVGHVHHEQVLVSAGWLRVGGKQYGGSWRLDGMAFRDHSQGGRDLTPFGGDHLLGAYFPASRRSLQTLIFWSREGKVHFRTASIYENGELETIHDVEMTGVEVNCTQPRSLVDLTGNPKRFEIMMNTRKGRVVVKGEVLHTANISLMGENINVNGSAINLEGDPMLMAECPIRLTWPDGEIGYGHFERTYKKSLLKAAAK